MTHDKPLEIDEVFAYLRVHDTAEALEFYARAFGAEEWLLGGEIEKVEPEEMQRRYDALFEGQA